MSSTGMEARRATPSAMRAEHDEVGTPTLCLTDAGVRPPRIFEQGRYPLASRTPGSVNPSRIPATDDWQQLESLCDTPGQRLYEAIRPILLFGQPVAERAAETTTHLRSVQRYLAGFEVTGLAGFEPVEQERSRRLPAAVRQCILDLRLKPNCAAAPCRPLRSVKIIWLSWAPCQPSTCWTALSASGRLPQKMRLIGSTKW
jgi:hypothetical protein